MFLVIPLENRPTWRNPPWMTVLLILLNMAVFWGPQRHEERAQERANAFYLHSDLPAIELPAFVKWQEQQKSEHAPILRKAYEHKAYEYLLAAMAGSTPFLTQLRADRVIVPTDPQFDDWKSARKRYDAQLPPPFTARWAQNHEAGAPWQPITLLTNAFLHADAEHLLGNMLFLFLFGFSVELALGRGLYLGFYLLGALGASALAQWAYAGMGGLGLGASGAVSAAMAMYAMIYRMRRIRFFYQFLFYFNYVTAPALLLLPAWIATELLQHFIGGHRVAYMAHLGGLLTGAALMALTLRLRQVEAPHAQQPALDETERQFAEQVARARKLSAEMHIEGAASAWKSAAQLKPHDAQTLSQWFNLARNWPASDDFHRCARLIFALPGNDPATLALQFSSYRTYLDLARPGARLGPDYIARLARRFAQAGELNDAEKLCRALLKSAPEHPQLAETLSQCVNALIRAGEHSRAKAWLPQLQQLAPQDAVTRLLMSS